MVVVVDVVVLVVASEVLVDVLVRLTVKVILVDSVGDTSKLTDVIVVDVVLTDVVVV